MRVPRLLGWDDLRGLLRERLASRPIVLLVLRWRGPVSNRVAMHAFACAAARVMRDGDAIAHDARRGIFALAMLAPARDGTPSPMLDARAALERIAAAMSTRASERPELGWWPLARTDEIDDLDSTAVRAIERGERERERFEFLATVGHELRTPLTSIRGYVETLLDEDVDAATARRFLEIVRREALRLGRLVDGMLEFSLLDLSSNARAGMSDLGSVVRAAIEALAPVAAQAGVTLRTSIELESLVRIDVDACMHAVLNIVENAVKYGRSGGSVIVRLERQGAFICVVVDDDGPGIAPHERERIFLHRARGAGAGDRRGSGIGLSIVRNIVERAGGSVSAADSPLGGARFIVRLPPIVSTGAESVVVSS